MRYFTLLIIVALSLAACSEPTSPEQVQEGAVIVPDGKEDDFLSLTGREYVIEGRYTVTLEEEYREAEEEARMERVHELIGYQETAIAWFLTQYFIEKKNDDPNADFGGYGAMARANSYEELEIEQEDDLVYSFRVYQLIAGRTDLLEEMAEDVTPIEGGGYEFVLTIGTPSNEQLARLETNDEWYRQSPWNNWNPETVEEARKTDLTLTIRPEVESSDAWFDFNELFADDLLTIDVHFGWDYHGDYHIAHAESLFGWLQREGFEAPVETFEELDRTSGPFTNAINANGRNVAVEVRLFWGHPDSDTNPDTAEGGRQLEDDMRESLRTRDVIIYSGHSGPFYGFALANWRTTDEGDLDDSEMSSVEMPEERYQVVFAEGCDTYHIGEAFRNNPAKPDGRYIDIITTTAPSDAGTPRAVQDMIGTLVEVDGDGRHQPRTMQPLLRDLDSNSFWAHTMYGIHGIDDNPQLHPYAVVENMCQECETDDDCGGVGNLCVTVSENTGRRCAPSCTTDAGCPGDSTCRSVADAWTVTIYDSACVPASLTCP